MKAFLATLSVFLFPALASAHEVYVLDQPTIDAAMAAVSPNPFLAYFGNEYHFYFWAIVSIVVVLTIAAVTFFRLFEKRCGPFLFRMKKFALPVARVTVGLCFIAFAYSGNLYGSELFLDRGFSDLAPYFQVLIAILGLLAVVGYRTRIVGASMVLLYLGALYAYGTYILTYTDFLGAALLLMILGGGKFSLDEVLKLRATPAILSFTKPLQPYAFLLLRICFGWGVLFASVYAKYIHSQLALSVVTTYDLTRFFPFDPLFVVLGALIIEFLAGLMILLGIAVRWTVLFLAMWLTLSLLYFQEFIWPHGILFGLAIAIFLHGYDRYTVEGRFLKRGNQEPVL